MEIDFDLSSKKWRANKKYLGKGVFVYKCQHISTTTNNYCKNKIFNYMHLVLEKSSPLYKNDVRLSS